MVVFAHVSVADVADMEMSCIRMEGIGFLLEFTRDLIQQGKGKGKGKGKAEGNTSEQEQGQEHQEEAEEQEKEQHIKQGTTQVEASHSARMVLIRMRYRRS